MFLLQGSHLEVGVMRSKALILLTQVSDRRSGSIADVTEHVLQNASVHSSTAQHQKVAGLQMHAICPAQGEEYIRVSRLQKEAVTEALCSTVFWIVLKLPRSVSMAPGLSVSQRNVATRPWAWCSQNAGGGGGGGSRFVKPHARDVEPDC